MQIPVWICDKCKKEERNYNYPAKWSTILIFNRDVDYFKVEEAGSKKHYCDECSLEHL